MFESAGAKFSSREAIFKNVVFTYLKEEGSLIKGTKFDADYE